MKFMKSFFKHPWIIICITVIITGVLGFFLKDLQMENSTRQFFPHKSESYRRLINTEEEFGSMAVIGVSIEANNGKFLTEKNIQLVRNICDRVEQLAEVESVDSLTNIDYVCESDGAISASPLMPDENWVQDESDSSHYIYVGGEEGLTQLKERLTTWEDMYSRVLLNDKGTATQMQFTIINQSDEEREALRKSGKKVVDQQQKALDAIRAILTEETQGMNVTFKVFGDVVISENCRLFILSDLKGLIPLVVLVVLITLWLSFKTLDGTIIPLLTVLISTVWTCGLMALFNEPFTIVSSIIPVALIATGSAYGIHILTHYYVAIRAINVELTKEVYTDAVFSGLAETFKAVFLAGVTTVVGFISLVSSPLQPLHSFAIYTAIGVGVALLLSVTFIPAILLVKPLSKVSLKEPKVGRIGKKIQKRLERLNGGRSQQEASGSTMYSIYRFFCGSRARLFLFSIFIVGFSLLGLRKLKIDTSLVNYFPEKSAMRQDINYVNDNFAGTNSVYFNITGQNKGDITNPELLNAIDELSTYLEEKYDEIGKIVALPTFIKRINQVWFTPSLAAESLSFEDDYSDESFSSFGSFSDDDFLQDDDFASFGSFGEDDFTSEFDSFSSLADEEELADDMVNPDYVDPNIIYSQRLSSQVTMAQVADWINQAYIAAGGKNATTAEIVKYLEKELNYNGAAYYEIPYNYKKYPTKDLQGVVNGYLQLLSGSLDRFIGKADPLSPISTRMQVQLRTHSTELVGVIISDVKQYAKMYFPEGYTLEATGTGEMEHTMTSMVISSQISALLISLLCVFIIIAVSFKSPLAGVVGALPLAFAILLNYMAMGFAHINLDLITSIIASVAVGIGIDYTIHFLTTYREERAKSTDIVTVTKTVFSKSGHGIITNAIAVGLGFLVLCFSKFDVLRCIGALVAVVMFTSAGLAMTIIPGILNIYEPNFIRPKEEILKEKEEEEQNN